MPDNLQHMLLANSNVMINSLREMKTGIDKQTETLIEIKKLLKEQLNFFVALESQERGVEDLNAKEYLNELKKDGFEPHSE